MVSIKKPAPKVSGKASTKPAAKAGGKPAAKASAPKTVKKGGKEYEIGETVTFVDYSEPTPEDEQFITPGSAAVIKDIEDRDDGKVYVLVAAEDSDDYDKNPDDVNGIEAIGDEIKKLKATSTKVAKVKEEPKPEEVNLSGDLAKMVKKAGDDVVGLAKTVFEEARKQFYFFGGIMAHVYNKNLHAPDGVVWINGTKEAREAWEEFCMDNFGMKPAQVRAYMDIYQTLSKIEGIDTKKIGEIGYSKMAEAARYITADNAEELIELASKTPITELKSTLKTEYLDEDGKTPSGRTARGVGKMSKTTFSFALFEDSAATIKFVFETAQKQLGLDNDAAVFEHIINEWASDKLDPAKMQKAKAAGTKVSKEAEKTGKVKPKAKVAA